MKLITHSPQIWTIENFLSEQECQDLIFFSENQGYQEATVTLKNSGQNSVQNEGKYEQKMMKNVRNNYRFIYQDQQLAQKYWQNLKEFCPQKIENKEAIGLNSQFRFYKYESNQRFKRHIDGRVVLENDKEIQESRITFMIYLNEDFEGGQTAFDEIEIQPKTGTALCFVHELKHEGKSVPKGTKYVLRSDIMYSKKE